VEVEVRRLVGNDKVPAEIRPAFRRIKALRQGLYLRPAKRWWPALEGLSPEVRAEVKATVRDAFVWEAGLPRFTMDGRRIS
jgi:hypothetical protein